MGTPEFAVGSLQRLVEGGYNVVAVVTQPDKPVGRHGSVLRAPAVKEYALAHNLPVLQPVKMKDPAFVEELRSYNADLQVVVAFRMLPEIVWAMPRFGTFNVHAALLPQYRGAAPINWAVINGETKTGVTTFFLDHDIDTGRIIMQKEFPIPDNADVEYVYDGLMALGADICIETVDAVINNDGNVPSQPQREDLPLKSAPKLFKETCLINWNKEAKQVYDFVRGLSPVPGAWCEIVHNDEKPGVVDYHLLACYVSFHAQTEEASQEVGVHFDVEHNRIVGGFISKEHRHRYKHGWREAQSEPQSPHSLLSHGLSGVVEDIVDDEYNHRYQHRQTQSALANDSSEWSAYEEEHQTCKCKRNLAEPFYLVLAYDAVAVGCHHLLEVEVGSARAYLLLGSGRTRDSAC